MISMRMTLSTSNCRIVFYHLNGWLVEWNKLPSQRIIGYGESSLVINLIQSRVLDNTGLSNVLLLRLLSC